MYQEVCFNRGTEAGGGVNVGHSLSPPSHFMLATGLSLRGLKTAWKLWNLAVHRLETSRRVNKEIRKWRLNSNLYSGAISNRHIVRCSHEHSRFLSGTAFSICEVVRVACQSHSCFVYAIDKPGDTASQMLKAMLESNLCSQDKPLWCSSVWLCPDSITTTASHIYNK